MKRELFRLIIATSILIGSSVAQLSFSKNSEKNKNEASINSRLGLLASSLGVEPVPGASVEKGGLHDNIESGGLYATGGGVHGGNNKFPESPGVGGNNYPESPGGVNNYGDPPVHGGNKFSEPVGGNNYPESPSAPLIKGPRCECVAKEYCRGRPGGGGDYGGGKKPNSEYIDSGLTSGQGISNPQTDGSGTIDIRIVNRPPVGSNCGPSQTYCCDSDRFENQPPVSGQTGGCGLPTIINVPGYNQVYGQADFGEYPWMAVILGSSNNYIGAGALIDSYHVLTAAHKVKDYKPGFQMKVRFGEWNAQDDSEPYKNIEIDVARVEVHHSFNSENLQNDIAIIKLAEPVDIDTYPHIKSVCLPNKPFNDYIGKRCWVPGFGKDAFKVGKHSYYLREVDVPILDSNDCENRLRQTRLGSYFTLNKKSFLCAGGEEGKDACQGDGGSPLVCQGYDGRFSVVGLVAWGIGCADPGIPGVYVNVPNYADWIRSKTDY